ncbi:MAG TPA: ATP-binding protein [Ramlibacter sp.]|uniref:ATP-binding protein n=1 Tax=Ramlibacter sp. TaxID=1917967 RepID=UPI002C6F5A66|nr:ATP-binding protein [Ramlibacter sp.]HVZ44455.1 ATP-binding protein [Ramlibacter sp.]
MPPLRRLSLPWPVAIGYVAAYAVLAWISYIRPLPGFNITPWNPQQALAIALVICYPQAAWLVWCSLFGSELALRGPGAGWLQPAIATATLTLATVLVARLLSRKEAAAAFDTRNELLRFFAIVLAGSLLDALCYVGFQANSLYKREGGVPGALIRYWVGDTVGLVVTLPPLLLALDPVRRSPLLQVLRVPGWWLSVALTGAGLWAIFADPEQEYFKYFHLLLLPLVWAAVRYGAAAAALSCVLAQLGLIFAAQHSVGRDVTVFELQVLMAASAMTALLLGVLVDERARVQAELRASLRFSAAGQMAAALAHELHQPLTAIQQFADVCQTLLSQGDVDSARRDVLDRTLRRLVEEARRAGTTSHRLRDFFTRGATSLQHAQLGPILAEAVEAHQALAERSGVTLAVRLEEPLPPIWADPVQLAVVLRNLLANAIESASQVAPERSVRVEAQGRDGMLRVKVIDSGEGIPRERLADLFDAAPSEKSGGMGVGLNICRAIVDAHGGKLWAEPGPGGRFFLTLPIDGFEPPARA